MTGRRDSCPLLLFGFLFSIRSVVVCVFVCVCVIFVGGLVVYGSPDSPQEGGCTFISFPMHARPWKGTTLKRGEVNAGNNRKQKSGPGAQSLARRGG